MTARALSGYKIRACVDWAALRVTLPHPTQPRHLRARMHPSWCMPYVQALDGAATSRTFEFRVQNPSCADEILAQAQSLAQDGAALPESAIEITGLEVAVDFTPSNPQARAALASTVAQLAENLAKPPPGTRRLLHKRSYTAAAGRRGIVAGLEGGCTLFIGDQGATDTARSYVKSYDSQPGHPYAPRPPEQHCARIERTLTGEDCPITTLEGWRAFKFEALAGHFAQVETTAVAPAFIGMVRAHWGPALGTPDSPAKRDAHRRQSAPATRRDTALNERIRQALRNLTARTKSAGIRWICEPVSLPATEANAQNLSASPKYLNTNAHDTCTSPVMPGVSPAPAPAPASEPSPAHHTAKATGHGAASPHLPIGPCHKVNGDIPGINHKPIDKEDSTNKHNSIGYQYLIPLIWNAIPTEGLAGVFSAISIKTAYREPFADNQLTQQARTSIMSFYGNTETSITVKSCQSRNLFNNLPTIRQRKQSRENQSTCR